MFYCLHRNRATVNQKIANLIKNIFNFNDFFFPQLNCSCWHKYFVFFISKHILKLFYFFKVLFFVLPTISSYFTAFMWNISFISCCVQFETSVLLHALKLASLLQLANKANFPLFIVISLIDIETMLYSQQHPRQTMSNEILSYTSSSTRKAIISMCCEH